MKIALMLFGYAAVLGVAAPWLLRRGWADRAPRLAVAAWQAVTVTVVVAVALGAVALAVPAAPFSGNLAHLLETCVLALRSRYATPGGAVMASAGAVLGLAVIARCAYCAVAELTRAARLRRRHCDALTLVARVEERLGAVVIDHHVPAAYCLPGRHRRIVLTSAAVDSLDDDQLRAVLAHEHAHLRGRHDLVVAGALALQRAFPKVSLFRIARDEIGYLVELLADDAATRAAPRLTLAEALLTVAGGVGPAGAVAAGGSTHSARVRRLIAAPRPASGARVAGGFAAIAGLLALPVLLFTGPAATAMPQSSCEIPTDCIPRAVECPLVAPGRHACPTP